MDHYGPSDGRQWTIKPRAPEPLHSGGDDEYQMTPRRLTVSAGTGPDVPERGGEQNEITAVQQGRGSEGQTPDRTPAHALANAKATVDAISERPPASARQAPAHPTSLPLERTMTPRIDDELAEQSEAEAMFSLETHATEATATALDMDATRLSGGVALSMRNDPTQFWSKALGFGFQEPVTAVMIENVCDFYRMRRTPVAVLQVAPSVLPHTWLDIHTRQGLEPGRTWVKLAFDLRTALDESSNQLDSTLRVAQVDTAQAGDWAACLLRGFGMPTEHLTGMLTPLVGTAGWHLYAVWHGDHIVAAAGMWTNGETAQLVGGATLPDWRGRGAQTALLVARTRAARDTGHRWMVAETGAETAGAHNSSLHNMTRLGFAVQYERRNWILRHSEPA
jgi:hypothetical protein